MWSFAGSPNIQPLASQFSAWCDVQELLSVHSDGAQIDLGHALLGLKIIDNRLLMSGHSAANDTVRTLAILAALLDGNQFVPPLARIPSYRHIPRWTSFLPHERFSKAVRISNESGGPLPRREPAELIQLYGAFDLKAVGMNSNGGSRVARIWWIAFNSAQSMQDFIWKVNGSEMDEQRLVVVPLPTTQYIHRKASDSSNISKDDMEDVDCIGNLFAGD